MAPPKPKLENRIYDAPIQMAKEDPIFHEVGLPDLDPDFDLVEAAKAGKFNEIAEYQRWSKPTLQYFRRAREALEDVIEEVGPLPGPQARKVLGCYHIGNFTRAVASQPGHLPTPPRLLSNAPFPQPWSDHPDGPALLHMWRYSLEGDERPSADFWRQAIALVFKTKHVLGKPLPPKYRLRLCYEICNAIIGIEVVVTPGGMEVRQHKKWEGKVPWIDEAEVVYWYGKAAGACDRVSNQHLFKNCPASHVIWARDNGNPRRVFVWDCYTMQDFFKVMDGTYEGPGELDVDMEDGEAQRLLNHFGLTWSSGPASRYNALRYFRGFEAGPGFYDAPEDDSEAAAAAVRVTTTIPSTDEDAGGWHMELLVELPQYVPVPTGPLAMRQSCTEGSAICYAAVQAQQQLAMQPGEDWVVFVVGHWLTFHPGSSKCPASAWEDCPNFSEVTDKSAAGLTAHILEAHTPAKWVLQTLVTARRQ